MPLKKAQKKEISSKLVEKIGGAESAVFVNFGKLTSADSNAIRSGLREKGIGYMVSKKTLIKRALSETKISGDMPKLEGQISIAYGNDSVLPAKSVAEFKSKLKEKISIVGGILGGKFMSASEMIALSKIPSREVLLGQLLNVMNAPIQGFVMSLDQIAKKNV
ncbi:MAG: 50S ribosomal protein L10 [Candidatus Vogelbacteria bacterium]|nr:50S ribosomal protein L10 [Candidatus Vogelbacteria bacterium]